LTPIAAPAASVGDAPPRRAAARGGIVGAAALGLVVVGASVAWIATGPGPATPTPTPPPTATRFGADAGERLVRLRDLLVRGLLSKRLPDGSWSPRGAGEGVDKALTTEATALAVAGLAAARRTGAEGKDLSDAIAGGRALLLARQTPTGSFGAPQKRNWGTEVVTLSAAVLALTLAGNGADSAALDRAGEALTHQASLGMFPGGWPRGIAVRAADALRRTGHLGALGGDLTTAVRIQDPPGPLRDARDFRVAEALARRVREGADASDPFPGEILAKCVAAGWEWGGEQTDLDSWAMMAWLAARTAGGDAWFVGVLGGLERAPDEAGAIPGEFYEYPVSRTACALLVLYEGWTPAAGNGP
jgi:hypothetical protein